MAQNKGQKGSTKHIHKTKDQATQTPLHQLWKTPKWSAKDVNG
jgi:hypothetical protein